MDMNFYYADEEYIDFLKKAEKAARGYTCVPNISYGNAAKFTFGAVLSVNGMNYYVPVSSYSKHQEDAILIRDKNNVANILGTLRFTYMIPIPKQCCKKVDINAFHSKKSVAHISKELAFCRRNRDKIVKQAEKTYKRVISRENDLLTKNSCDFKLLEQAYTEFCKTHSL